MRVTLELGDNRKAGLDEQVDVDLPAVPRIGEQILWCDEVADEDGTWVRQREYRVRMVDWTVSPTSMGEPFILLRLDLLPNSDAGAEARSARDDLWDALGIDPDRISREEFDQYLNVYDHALAARQRNWDAEAAGFTDPQMAVYAVADLIDPEADDEDDGAGPVRPDEGQATQDPDTTNQNRAS